MNTMDNFGATIRQGMYHRLFEKGFDISPGLNEVYELALAYYESTLLSKEDLIRHGAYFIQIDKQYTNHFIICTGDPLQLPEYSSSRLKSFFKNNQFRTGYATHGLFPYRGKFHPQMIKALINIMGIKPGNTILDPMMGSGTTPVEAAVMGIHSIGVDASPFCRFMAQAKYDGLSISQDELTGFGSMHEKLFASFVNSETSLRVQKEHFLGNNFIKTAVNPEKLFNLIFLAFLDSAGYAQRSKRKNHLEHFESIMNRYIAVVSKFGLARESLDLKIGNASLLQGDARKLDIASETIDGIIFSPPYSFAIDYLSNDHSHLAYFQTEPETLRAHMIGLRGKQLKEKYSNYVEDMETVLSECFRVLKNDRFCTIIIGTNDSQLSRVLKIPKEEVPGLNQAMVDMGQAIGFRHIRSIPRQILGMANTMRHEYIVILQK